MIPIGPGSRRPPFRAPVSEHRDSRWYRSAATKTSTATPEALPDGRATDDVAWVAVSHLAAGILLYSGLGWLVGNWLGNQAVCVAVGTLVGTAFALYLVFARLGVIGTGPETPRQDDDDRLAPTPHGGRRTDAHHPGAGPWLT